MHKTMDKKLRALKDIALYGGMCVIFRGDFRQLPPVNGTPLYMKPTDPAGTSLERFERFWDSLMHAFVLATNYGIMDAELRQFAQGRDDQRG